MKTIAIIAEYNPFHNGHLFLLNEAKKITEADYSIAIMSGNFMQRGLPAICDKYSRAYMAVSSGVDLCLELPFVYATGSAYDFANGAVNILNSLNTVDYLCFGAESDNLKLFNIITDVIADEPSDYLSALKSGLKAGLSYPAARQKAITDYIKNDSAGQYKADNSIKEKDVTDILSKPNNILATEYLAALKRTNSPITPIIIKREGSMYNDSEINGSVSSALSIRNKLSDISHLDNKDIKSIDELLCHSVPTNVLSSLISFYNIEYPLNKNALLPFIQDKCLSSKEKHSNICDLTPALLNKLYKSNLLMNYDELVESLKSKDITETRINRALLHLILEYTQEDREMFYDNGPAFYSGILSFKESCTELIKNIKAKSSIPLITKKSDFEKSIKDYSKINEAASKRMWQLDITATKLYQSLVYNSLGTVIPNDFTVNIPIA